MKQIKNKNRLMDLKQMAFKRISDKILTNKFPIESYTI